jgi:sulfofructose kinase
MILEQVWCVGSVTADVIVRVAALPAEDERLLAEAAVLACGGPAATAAVASARLGAGTVLVGRVGADPAGELAAAALTAAGVGTRWLAVNRGAATAVSAVLLETGSAGRRIVTSAPLTPVLGPDLLAALAAFTGWVHVDHAGWAALREADQLLPFDARPWRLSVDGGNPIADLDLSVIDLYAPTLTQLRAVTGLATGPSDAPVHGEVEVACRAALAAGARSVVATDGGNGSFALDASGDQMRWMPAMPVDAVSTVGAGDVFHGALVAAQATGSDLARAQRMASVAAALSCLGLDGQSAVPDRDRVLRALETTDISTAERGA